MCRKHGGLLLAVFIIAFPVVSAEPPATEQSSTAVAAACARCGDGVCARSCENEFSCPADCKPQPSVAAATRCGKCGDGQCVKQCGETALSCPVDCGGTPQPSSAKAGSEKCGESTTPAEPKKD